MPYSQMLAKIVAPRKQNQKADTCASYASGRYPSLALFLQCSQTNIWVSTSLNFSSRPLSEGDKASLASRFEFQSATILYRVSPCPSCASCPHRFWPSSWHV